MKALTSLTAASLTLPADKNDMNKNLLLHAMMELNWENIKTKSPHVIADMIRQKLDELGFCIAEK